MALRTLLACGILVLVLLALAPACESTDVTAPANSTIILQAIPASVLIDQDVGETAASTQIYAQVLGPGGLPLEDIPVTFTSSGGRLDSENFCDFDGSCTRTGGPCADDGDCPLPASPAVNTNSDGAAVDRLTLRLIEDGATVDVTAQISVGSQKISVAKNVNLGPEDPKAKIVAVPPSSQLTGLPFVLDATGTTFDPQVELTCFEWTVDSSIDANDEVFRGAGLSVLNLTLGDVGDSSQDQDLTVTLRVSDVAGIACNNLTTPDPQDMSPFSAVIDYEIKSWPDPVAKIVAVPSGGQRTGQPFLLDGSGTTFDPQLDITCFEWTVDSSIDANDDVVRGPSQSTLNLTLGTVGDPTQDQDLTIRLRVSDEPGIVCNNLVTPDPQDMSPFSAVIDYAIRCDVTDPTVNGGSNVFASLAANNGVVSVDLNAVAGDPEDPELEYQWNCGTGGVLVTANGKTVTCEYYTEGTNTAKVTVLNDCGRTAEDSVIVQINP